MPRDPGEGSDDLGSLRRPSRSPRDDVDNPRSASHPARGQGALGIKDVIKDAACSSSCSCFCEVPKHYPAATSIGGLVLIGAVVLIGMAGSSNGINTSFTVDLVESNSTRKQRAFDAALQMREPGTRLFKNLDVKIAYEWKKGAAINHEALLQVAALEQRMRSSPQWQALCSKTDSSYRQFCEVGLSYANYALPEHQPPGASVVPEALAYNGIGLELLPLPPLRQILRRHDVTEVFLPEEVAHNSALDITAIRSIFRFRFFCCSVDDSTNEQMDALESITKDFKAFLEDELLPLLRQPGPPEVSFESWPLRVWFSLPVVDTEIEVDADVFADMDQAVVGSLFMVLLCLLIHTRNLVISIAGLGVLTLAPLLTHTLFGVFEGHKLSVASAAALFPILGLGVDNMLLYVDTWQSAVERAGTEAERLHLTWNDAACRTFWAALVSSLTFFAMGVASNSFLREIGCFLSVVVFSQWAVISMLYVPLCALDERYCVVSRCGRICALDPARSPVARQKLAYKWQSFVRRWRRPCVGAFVAVFLACATLTIIFVRIEDTSPQIFPDAHNQNRGRRIMALFKEAPSVLDDDVEPPPAIENVCSEEPFSSSADCSLFWCDAQTQSVAVDRSGCTCFQKEKTTTCSNNGSPANLTIVQRFFGLSPAQLSLGGANSATPWYLTASNVVEELPLKRLQPLILQEWETGSMQIEPVTEASTKISRDSTNVCEWQELCYCGGASQCRTGSTASDWSSSQSQVNLPAAALASHSENRWPSGGSQSQSTTSATGVPRIRVVVGLAPNVNFDDTSNYPEMGSLWSFPSSPFHPSNLWAQRALLQFCAGVSKDIRILGSTCWLEAFKEWNIESKNGRFPVPENEFDNLVTEFVALPAYKHFSDAMWFRGGKVIAWYLEFDPDISANATSDEVLAYKASWDNYVRAWSLQHDAEGTQVKACGCLPWGVLWHTSTLWSKVQAEEASLSGHLVSVILVAFVAVLGSVAVNWPDICGALSSGIVVLLCIFVMLFVAGFVTHSNIGLVEIVGITSVLVNCVSYSIHLALGRKSTGELDTPEQRDAIEFLASRQNRERATFAFSSMVSSALWSCIVITGCSVFLAIGYLPVFRSIGATAIIGAPATTILVLTFVLAFWELPAEQEKKDLSMPVQRIPNSPVQPQERGPPSPIESQERRPIVPIQPQQRRPSVEPAVPAEHDCLNLQEQMHATSNAFTSLTRPRSPPPDEELAAEREELPPSVTHEVVLRLPDESQEVVGNTEIPRVKRAVARASKGGSQSAAPNNPHQWKAALL